MTQIARIVAEDMDDLTRRVVLMCGVDGECRLVDGEWMGYYVDKTSTASSIDRKKPHG